LLAEHHRNQAGIEEAEDALGTPCVDAVQSCLRLAELEEQLHLPAAAIGLADHQVSGTLVQKRFHAAKANVSAVSVRPRRRAPSRKRRRRSSTTAGGRRTAIRRTGNFSLTPRRTAIFHVAASGAALRSCMRNRVSKSSRCGLSSARATALKSAVCAWWRQRK